MQNVKSDKISLIEVLHFNRFGIGLERKHLYILFFCLLFLAFNAQTDTSVKALFSFNDFSSINEISGKAVRFVNANHVSDRFGNPHCAAYTHGAPGSYLNLGSGPDVKPEIGSVSIWVKVEGIMYSGRGYQFNPVMVVRNGVLDSAGRNDDFCEAYCLFYDYKTHRMRATSADSPEKQVGGSSLDTVTISKWHHFVITWDYNYLSLYMDGELQVKLPKNYKTRYSETDPLLIGNTNVAKNSRYFCGAVDDIIIYNRVISPGEVTALYHAPDPNKNHRYLQWGKWLLLAFLVVLLIIWFFLRRAKKDLQRQKEQNEINARMNELETRAIRTQMNPHFMFNSLNTLQRLILEGDEMSANSYLVKFSGLLRKLLETSSSESISLSEEIKILTTYVELEKLRFDKSFHFDLQNNVSEPDKVYIPLMLIQPFAENAIWHGLLPKKDNRRLTISFIDLNEDQLLCRIEDNGVGRGYSIKRKDPFRKKSMAIEFIKQRLEILEKVTHIKNGFTIIDKEDEAGNGEGTVVEIIIPKLKT